MHSSYIDRAADKSKAANRCYDRKQQHLPSLVCSIPLHKCDTNEKFREDVKNDRDLYEGSNA